MKRFAIAISLIGAALFGCAQPKDEFTTLILVRHAEKENDGTKDPGLTAEGKARAADLVKILGETKIDAVYSTNYKRTMSTVEPLAAAKGLSILTYNPMKGEEMDRILQAHAGATIVICGHSNTTPWVANYFLDKEELADFKDSDYDNLIILSVLKKGNTKVTLLNYGNPTN
jgi:broad specificity phosphatase PhoE